MLKVISMAALVVLSALSVAQATLVLEPSGRTYEIVEQDLLEEIENRAAAVDWAKALEVDKMEEKIKNFQPEGMQRLPRAIIQREYEVDPTYVLEFDIPHPYYPGEILYPKGFTFNPLDYQPFTSIIVILNAADPDQVAWFDESPYLNDMRTRVLLSDGNYYAMMERWERPIYYLFEAHAQRLKVSYVPAVIMQKNNMLHVTEYYLEPGYASHQKAKKEALDAEKN